MKNATFSRKFLLAGITAGLAATAQAATVTVLYSFTPPSSGDSAAARLAPTSVSLPNLTASSITPTGHLAPSIVATASTGSPGSFITSTTEGSPGGHLSVFFPNTTSANDSEAEAAALNVYFDITLTVAAGYTLDLDTLKLDYTATNPSNGRTFFVRYDTSAGSNNFAGPSLEGATFGGTGGTFVTDFGTDGNLGTIPTVNGGEDVTLRFFAYRTTASTTAQNLRYDDITITGDLSAVPEPSAALLGALSALCLLRRRR